MDLTPEEEAERLIKLFEDHNYHDLVSIREDAVSTALIHIKELFKHIPMYLGNLNPEWKYYDNVKKILELENN